MKHYKFIILLIAVLMMASIQPVLADTESPYSDTDIQVSTEIEDSDGLDVSACPKDDTCPITPFTDTNKNEWYHDGVHWAIENGVMNGTGDNTFEPLTTTTRAMIVTMLWRMEGSPEADGTVTFKDVPGGQWYTDAICWAAASNIVNGYDEDTFGPNDSVTREQLATILYRSAKVKGQGFTGPWAFVLNYDDASRVSDWADEAMHWMVMNGIIQGMSDKELSPQGDAVRAQVATMLMRFCEKIQNEDDTGTVNTGKVWQYSYAGVEHPYLTAVSDYLCKYDVENLEIKDGMIPCITSIEIDNEEESDIKMWGIYDLYNYSLVDKTLVEENGKRLLGLFHLDQSEDGSCTVKEASFVEEGDDQAVEALCEGHEMALEGLKNPKVTEESRRWFISEYVRTSGLEVTHYLPKDGDARPISYEKQDSPDWVASLPEAQETDSLIIVDVTIGSNAVLTMQEKNAEGIWEQTLDEAAFIGKNGLGKTKEGDLKTPVGTFYFNSALGINDDPGCALGYTKVDDTHYWVGDSNSDRYNKLVSTDDYTDFNIDDSEHIVDYPNAYKYILNTTYNEEGTPGKGSAIFLHCYREERTYTGGCISIPLEKMEYVMKHVKEDTSIIIRKQF